MIKPPEESPAVWHTETTPHGGTKRYRLIGHVKEYEATTNIDGVEVPESQLKEFLERRKKADAARIDAQRQKAKDLPQKICPFNSSKNHCTGSNCALYDNGCGLAIFPAKHDTIGRNCPLIGGVCRKACALYNSGCSITGITGIKERISKHE